MQSAAAPTKRTTGPAGNLFAERALALWPDDGETLEAESSAAFVDAAAGVLSGRWKCVILFQLFSGTARFSALRRALGEITPRTLTNQLRELEAEGLVERRVYAEVPVRVDYTITAHGRSLEPVLRALERWARSHVSVRAVVASGSSTDLIVSPR